MLLISRNFFLFPWLVGHYIVRCTHNSWRNLEKTHGSCYWSVFSKTEYLCRFLFSLLFFFNLAEIVSLVHSCATNDLLFSQKARFLSKVRQEAKELIPLFVDLYKREVDGVCIFQPLTEDCIYLFTCLFSYACFFGSKDFLNYSTHVKLSHI